MFEFQALLGYLAGKYPGMRLGVGVTEAMRRHPVILAQAAQTLAHLSQAAPILGVGSGERLGADPYGLDFRRSVSRFEEALHILRRCLDERGPISFKGEFFQLDGAVQDLQAPDGCKPEIWVAAHGPRMLQLAGRYGDGWYPFGIATPDQYAAGLDVIRQAATDAGRDPDAITPALHPFTILAPTEAEARAMLDTPALQYFGILMPNVIWQMFGRTHPLGDDFAGYLDILPETLDRKTLDAAMDMVPLEMLEAILFWGTPDHVLARLRGFGEAGLRHVVPVLIYSEMVSAEAAAYSKESLLKIAHALRTGE